MKRLYVFIDESGTHALKVPNEENPLFCLAACLFDNEKYETVKTQIAEFKREYLGHAHVPLHLYNIRSKDGPFKFLRNPELRRNFNTDLKDALSKITAKIIACVVDKRVLLDTYGSASWNPYHYALECILERVFLKAGEHRSITFTVSLRKEVKKKITSSGPSSRKLLLMAHII